MKRAATTLLLFVILTATTAGARAQVDVLYSIGPDGGWGPRQGMTLGPDGNLYGGTASGGPTYKGTLFSISPTGSFTPLYTFSGPDGAQPYGALAVGPGGNLFGTTLNGGAGGLGTVYELVPGGTVSMVHSFTGVDGAAPTVGLTCDDAGNLYGTTSKGGPSNCGTVFEIASDGTFRTVYAFSGTDGQTPASNIAVGVDGSLYGSTRFGGDFGMGNVYKIAPDGTCSSLYSFDGSNGSAPRGTILYGPDGNVYGLTPIGGAYGNGMVFQLTPAGNLTVLHSFNGLVDGQTPTTLMLGKDGSFYGATSDGGPNWFGTVYAVDHLGNFSFVHGFSGTPDGGNPSGSMAQLPDGTIFGSTVAGGANNKGCVFSFAEIGTPNATPPTTSACLTAQSGAEGYYGGDVTVTLTATDPANNIASTWYTVDGNPIARYTSPFGVSGEGSHSITFWSWDWSGNREPHNTQTFVIDTTPPATTGSLSGSAGNAGWYVGPVTVSLIATDASPVTTSYSLDGGPTQTYSAPFSISDQGSHTVNFQSTDAAGNVESPHSLTVRIDSMPPSLTFGTPNPAANAAGWNNGPVSLPFSVADTGSGVASTSLGSPLQFTSEGQGQTMTVTAVDGAGNSATSTSPAVNIDLTPPSTTASVNGATVTLSATDALSGVASTSYAVDGGATLSYSSPFTLTGSGTHTVAYWSADVAGNVEAAQTVSVTMPALVQEPTLEWITPNRVFRHEPIFLVLYGSGFCWGSAVKIGGATLPAYEINPRLLLTIVPENVLCGVNGTVPVCVVNPDGSMSQSLPFTVIEAHRRW